MSGCQINGIIAKSASYQDVNTPPPPHPLLFSLKNDPSDLNPDSLVAVGDIKRLTAVAHFTAIINTLHVPELKAVNEKREGKKMGQLGGGCSRSLVLTSFGSDLAQRTVDHA